MYEVGPLKAKPTARIFKIASIMKMIVVTKSTYTQAY